MTTKVEKSIDVDVPVSVAYNQWTQFEEFPQFMGGVSQVQQIDDRRLHWVAEIAGVKREWDAEILEQVPDTKVAWAATSGATNAGAVYFTSLGAGRTSVRLSLEYEPEGLVEAVGDKLNIVEKQAEADLEKFKQFIESRGTETGAWRGEVGGAGTVGTPGVEDAAASQGDSGKAGLSGKAVAGAAAAATAAAAGVAAAVAAKKSPDEGSASTDEITPADVTTVPPADLSTGAADFAGGAVAGTTVPATEGVSASTPGWDADVTPESRAYSTTPGDLDDDTSTVGAAAAAGAAGITGGVTPGGAVGAPGAAAGTDLGYGSPADNEDLTVTDTTDRAGTDPAVGTYDDRDRPV